MAPRPRCVACFTEVASARLKHAFGPLFSAQRPVLCSRCREAVEHDDPKARVAKWGLAAMRRAMFYLAETGDPGVPFVLLLSANESDPADGVSMLHLIDLHGAAAADAAKQAVTDHETRVRQYALAIKGFVDERTKSYAFEPSDPHDSEAILYLCGGPGCGLAMLMGQLVRRDERGEFFEEPPSFFLGTQNWCDEG